MSDFISFIKGLFFTSPIIAWTVVGLLIAIFFITILWDKVRWFVFNQRVNWSLLGDWAKNFDSKETKNGKTWYQAEKELGSAYRSYMPAVSKEVYDQNSEYIKAAGDNGKHIKPKLIWLVVLAVILIEAFGFSYVLAGFAIPGVSENNQQIAGLGIALLLALLLVAVTEVAGHSLNKALAIKKARKLMTQDALYNYERDVKGKRTQAQEREFEDKEGKSLKRSRHPFGTVNVGLKDNQYIDADEPGYSRQINRIQEKESKFIWVYVALVIIFLVAIGATYIRGQVLEQINDEDVKGQKAELVQEQELQGDGMRMGDEVDENILPPKSDLEQAREASFTEIERSAKIPFKGGWATFIVLAIIFIGIQLMSIYFSYHWSFVGSETKTAYFANKLNKYGTFAALKKELDERADVAEAMMQKLHQKMIANYEKTGSGDFNPTGTFRQFLADYKDDESQPLQEASFVKESAGNSVDADLPLKEDDNDFDLNKCIAEYQALDSKIKRTLYLTPFSEEQRKVIRAGVTAVVFDFERAVEELESLSEDEQLKYLDDIDDADVKKKLMNALKIFEEENQKEDNGVA